MAFKKVLYKLRGIYKFGKIARLRGKVFVNKFGEIQIGKNLSIVGHPWAVQITSTKGANLTFGDNVYVNAGVGIAANT